MISVFFFTGFSSFLDPVHEFEILYMGHKTFKGAIKLEGPKVVDNKNMVIL